MPSSDENKNMGAGVIEKPPMPETIYLSKAIRRIDFKRLFFILLGLFLFFIVYFSPPWGDAVDPLGKHFILTREGKAALGLFLLAVTWWVFEVVPIAITSIAVGVIQALFLIRTAQQAFTDFMDPSIWFIFGSLMIGMVFTKTGLTQRMAYRMLVIVGERTSMIYFGCFLMIATLTLVMAHTAVAATVFPLLMAIYALYEDTEKPTRFGKGLFIGMAFASGAGSVVTLLGSARAPVAIGFFKEFAGGEISFLRFSCYMAPVGLMMVISIWAFIMIFFHPEKKSIPGLHERAKNLHARLGPMSRNEVLALIVVTLTIAMLSLRSFIPFFRHADNSAIILAATLLFFFLNILSIKDLEEIPWNIVLLFGGAMSMGFCLWETGADNWLAVKLLPLFWDAHWFIFAMATALFVLITTNFIINVAVIAISLPVAITIAQYLGVNPDVMLFSFLATAGMPFMLLVGAAPNAMAYGSGQFTSREFFKAGLPASIVLMILLGIFVRIIWPLMGMPPVFR